MEDIYNRITQFNNVQYVSNYFFFIYFNLDFISIYIKLSPISENYKYEFCKI